MQKQIDELKRNLNLVAKRLGDLETFLTSLPKTRGSVEMMIRDREYERVISEMKQISHTYGDHQSWTPEDRERYRALKQRRDELRKILGIKV